MIWIRIFRTKVEAEFARQILEEEGFKTSVSQDNLFGIPIEVFGVPARFRLMVEQKDFERVAEFLARKLNKRKK